MQHTPFITYYTSDMGGHYEKMVKRLYEQCDHWGIRLYATHLKPLADWHQNCKLKPRVIASALETLGEPFVFVDANTFIHAAPAVFDTLRADFATHRLLPEESPQALGIRATPLYFSPSDASKAFVASWLEECNKDIDNPKIWGCHNSLSRVFKEWEPKLRFHDLDLSYSWIRGKSAGDPVLELVIAKIAEKYGGGNG